MKKLLLTMICALMSMAAMAQMTKPFEDNLVVTINGESTAPQKTTVYLTLNEDNTCNFALNNFMLDGGDGNIMPVGNIFIESLPLSLSEDGYYTFSYDGNLVITEGDLDGYDTWLGPMLGEIPLKLKGKATMDKVYVTIDIDMMETLGQIIYVTFGSDFGSADDLGMPFTDDLIVTINGESTAPQQTTVYLSLNEDNTCNFVLPNFMLDGGDGNIMPVGNIVLKNLPLAPSEEGYYTFSYDGTLLITAGNAAGYDTWLGPLLGEIPLKLRGKATMDKVYVTIDIDMMETLQQIIYVTFGSDFGSADDLGMPFTDDLVVTINGESTAPQQTTVYLSLNEDNTCNFVLPNFMLDGGDGNIMPVGNIVLKSLPLAPGEDGYYTFSYDGTLLITEGNAAGYDTWLGPLLGEIPLKLNGKATMEKVYVTIDIDMMETLQQIIYVTFGTDFTPAPPATYALSFVVDGQTISTAELEAGSTIVYPEVDSREGYTFAWDNNATTMPAEALTITGTYNVNNYKLTFVVDGETISETTVNYGATVEVPTVDEKTGYTFAWTDKAPETMPAQDVTVNGKFTVNTYKVIYLDTDGKTVLVSFDVEYGAAMPEAPEYKLPESDERYSYSFLGWEGETFETMPAHDVVYTANVDIVDGISAVALQQNAVVYNLNGQRVNKVQRDNVYIINGKKVLVK